MPLDYRAKTLAVHDGSKVFSGTGVRSTENKPLNLWRHRLVLALQNRHEESIGSVLIRRQA